MKNFKYFSSIICLILFLSFISCARQEKPELVIKGKNIEIEFNILMHSRINARFKSKKIRMCDFTPSEFILTSEGDIKDFIIQNIENKKIADSIGTGIMYIITGTDLLITKELFLTLYDDFPGIAIFQVQYTNNRNSDIILNRWTNNNYLINAESKSRNDPLFWSFQSGSYEHRPDWIFPLYKGFSQDNYMGMNASDYGGGTPVSDIWTKNSGIAVGHVETVPKLVSIPVIMEEETGVSMCINSETNVLLKHGESLTTLRTFVAVHQGDFFNVLSEYRRFMTRQGIEFKAPPQSVYEPIWCAWGYERDFTLDQIYGTLPIVKRLGYKWAVLDDGWQTAEGDWYLNKKKFPKGDPDMKNFTNRIHEEGLKAKLWWAPLAVDPGTDLIKKNKDFLLINDEDSFQDITWWDAFYLCPADSGVRAYTKDLVTKFLTTWNFDGLKIDGQHLNAAPSCFNKSHNHKYPEESVEKLPEFFKLIYETALNIKPDAVVEICPCGTAASFFNMPYMNQPVASDPTSSWQIRSKGKTFKALMGPSTAYYGDHVELSDKRQDFASTVGIGGVIGTKFTWPLGSKKGSDIALTLEYEKIWDKWIKIYREKMLPTGSYLGSLYDIGFDQPETHVIRKGDDMYYAFYADSWKGKVELRGLERRKYRVFDYISGKDYGTVRGPKAKLAVKFEGWLLVEVRGE
jgi:alpha-galactosidase